MRNALFAAVVLAGATTLGACNPTTTAEQNVAGAIEEQADNMEAMADATSNVAASEAMENTADALEERADDIGGGDMTPNSSMPANGMNAMNSSNAM